MYQQAVGGCAMNAGIVQLKQGQDASTWPRKCQPVKIIIKSIYLSEHWDPALSFLQSISHGAKRKKEKNLIKWWFFEVLILLDPFDCHSENVYVGLSSMGKIFVFLKVGIPVGDDNSTVTFEKMA